MTANVVTHDCSEQELPHKKGVEELAAWAAMPKSLMLNMELVDCIIKCIYILLVGFVISSAVH